MDPFAATSSTQCLEHGTQVQVLGWHSARDTARRGSESWERKERSACHRARRPVSGVSGTPRQDLTELQRRNRGADRSAPGWVARLRPRVQAATLCRRVIVQLDQDDELQGGYVLQQRLGACGQLSGSSGCANLK